MTTDTQTPTLLRGPEPIRQKDGSACGDYSIGDEFSACFIWDMHDGTFVMIETTYYITAHIVRDGEVTDLDYDDWEHLFMTGDEEGSDPNPDRDLIRYAVKCQTMALRCTDPGDPGMTEMGSDYEYEDRSSIWIETLDAAHDCAAAWLADETESMYDPSQADV